jgi:hypothetical protein
VPLGASANENVSSPVKLHHETHGNLVQAALIAAVAGLLSGTLGSGVAPWLAWRIDKHRDVVGSRKARADRTERPEDGTGSAGLGARLGASAPQAVGSIVVRNGVKRCQLVGSEALSSEASDAQRGWLLGHHGHF